MVLVKKDTGWEILNKAYWYKIPEIRQMLLNAYDLACLGNDEPPYIWEVLQDDDINELYEMLTSLLKYGDEDEFQHVSEAEREEFIAFRNVEIEPPLDRDFLKMVNQYHLFYQDAFYKYRNFPVGRVW